MHQTLPAHLSSSLAQHPEREALASVLLDIAKIGKEISRHTSMAGLAGILGETGETNIQNETVQKLDVFCNELCKEVFRASTHFVAFASEEEDAVVDISENATGEYVIAFDPLDGSSNIDVNVSIGTIFSVFKMLPEVPYSSEAHFLQKGRDQVLAGYVLYGTSTVLVFSFGGGVVFEFTLNPEDGEWYLSQTNLSIPSACPYYSVNEANARYNTAKDVSFVEYLKAAEKRSLRYIGSLVADVHRGLIKGGVFLYPAMDKDGAGVYTGRLRMNFELKPLAFVIENAGGLSIDGAENILDRETTSLHERAGFISGNREMIEKYMGNNFKF